MARGHRMNARPLAAPEHLTVDSVASPVGNHATPRRFGWSPPEGAAQLGYEIELGTDALLAEAPFWSSGRVDDDRPFDAPYGGPPLASRTRYWWRVRLRTPEGTTAWSTPAAFDTGLADDDWAAAWITDPWSARDSSPRTLYFRREVDLPAAVLRGRAYASALGWYRLVVNGSDLTGPALVPRWTSFAREVEYQEYDPSAAFRPGRNVIGLVVSEGRFRGRNGSTSTARMYGDRLAAIARIELDLADGSTAIIVTDERWQVGTGRIASADPKFGERVDLRIPSDAWLAPGGRAIDQRPVELLPSHPRRLIAEQVERFTEIGRRAGTISRTPSGLQLIDFGQNLTGVARLRLAGASGSAVTVFYGEVLTPDGELETATFDAPGRKGLDQWFQRDEIVLGDEPEHYTPSFTFRGFRYVAVRGLEEPLSPRDVEAIVLSTDMPVSARFRASDARLERLHENVLWSLRSNFLDTATDCPTRERSGWTGDVQVFAPTAAILTRSQAFLERYLRNVAADQFPDGRVPPIIPREPISLLGFDPFEHASSSAGWGDVAVMLPLTMHRYFGDERILRTQYPSARAWVDSLIARAAGGNPLRRIRLGARRRLVIDRGYDFGEWLRPGEHGLSSLVRNLFRVNSVVATAYLANSARLLAETAGVIGEAADERRYRALAMRVRDAWCAAFVRDGGARIGEDRQDDYVRALAFDLLPVEHRPVALRRLVELIEAADDHLGTGFLSTPLLLSTLADHGRADVAYRLLMQRSAPSWLDQVERGATTTWETWEGYGSDGRAVESHNHYAFGSVASWLHEYVAGLRPAAPGYREILVAPLIGGGLTAASSTIRTPYGTASSGWTVDGSIARLAVTIPASTTATVRLGDGAQHQVGAGAHVFSWRLDDP